VIIIKNTGTKRNGVAQHLKPDLAGTGLWGEKTEYTAHPTIIGGESNLQGREKAKKLQSEAWGKKKRQRISNFWAGAKQSDGFSGQLVTWIKRRGIQ